MLVITPVLAFSDCCEAYSRPAMRLAPTMLPIACISNEGEAPPSANDPKDGAGAAGPLTKSAQVIVLAGSWIVILHGITTGPLFSVRVPPKRLGWSAGVL